jgi:alkanesulfonate monooxygenase SsuD/methylene tetrahydromethanopterin reductase-like flavin-dependent oxidoreductase (luciferase family)
MESVSVVDGPLILRSIEIYEDDRLDFAEARLVACAESTVIGNVALSPLVLRVRPSGRSLTHVTLAINANERVTWSGTTRASSEDALVVPRADGGLKIWLGTGANLGSCVRAGVPGITLPFGIPSGSTEDWVWRADLYREAATQSGHGPGQLDIAVASHGFGAADGADAKCRYFEYGSEAFDAYAAEHGSPSVRGRSRDAFDADAAPGGMIFAGGPDEIADQLIDFHQHLGHRRHILQMDLGHIT